MSANILFISEQTLKDRSLLQDNIDPKLIKPTIKQAQDMFIEPILGTGLYLINVCACSCKQKIKVKKRTEFFIWFYLVNWLIGELVNRLIDLYHLYFGYTINFSKRLTD